MIREMEYIEHLSSNTLCPLQNKHQIHRHTQSVRRRVLMKYQNIVKVMKWARLRVGFL